VKRGDVTLRSREGCHEIVTSSPILSVHLLERLTTVITTLSARPLPLVVASGHPRIFLAGADLGEIAKLNAATSGEYSHRGRRLLELIESFPAPVVAAVGGACTGGGLDLALACDAIVASPTAAFAHPGVRRGLVTGWGGTVRLPHRAGVAEARRVLLEGGFTGAGAAAAEGWVTTTGAADPVAAAKGEALRLAAIAPRRLDLWRTFRSARFVDRFRASVVHNGGMQECLDDRETP